MEKDIYIMISQTNTGCSRILQFFTGDPYNHASISLDENLNSLYSFARQKLYNPLIAGFVKEDINSGIYKIYDNTLCEIYRLKITDEQYKALEESINEFKNNESEYKYNFAGLIAILFNIPYHRPKHYVCSQFVAYVLQQSNVIEFDKHFTLVRPYDFKSLSGLDLVYSGKLCEYSV
ncbi:MAG: hypothetical protein ACI398_00520 [Clostridium sp.]